MRILGIETSCDETSAAVIDGEGRVLSSVISSQIERHRPFGGVVPEIASREHLQSLMPIVRRVLEESATPKEELDGIAVTVGPGLIGALLVGVAAAQGLAWGLGIRLIAVNHLEGHVFSPWITGEDPALPVPDRLLSLVVSGGHSSFYEVIGGAPPRIRMLNRTRDDAAGEVFDKVAKFVGLAYPGGPHIERVGRGGNPERYPFTLARLKDDSADFSFSGLKAAAIRLARELDLARAGEGAEETPLLADFCASFQKAIGDQILDRLDQVWRKLPPGSAPLSSGWLGASRPIRPCGSGLRHGARRTA
jgi:N6-L-threonylcarbamoyladenine synthase